MMLGGDQYLDLGLVTLRRRADVLAGAMAAGIVVSPPAPKPRWTSAAWRSER
jgi:hypothetical protein